MFQTCKSRIRTQFRFLFKYVGVHSSLRFCLFYQDVRHVLILKSKLYKISKIMNNVSLIWKEHILIGNVIGKKRLGPGN